MKNILLLFWTGWKYSAVTLNRMKKFLLLNWIGWHVSYCLFSRRSVDMYSTVLHSDSRTANSNASFLCKARQFTHMFFAEEVFEWLCIYKWLIRKTKNWQKINAVTKLAVLTKQAQPTKEPLHDLDLMKEKMKNLKNWIRLMLSLNITIWYS